MPCDRPLLRVILYPWLLLYSAARQAVFLRVIHPVSPLSHIVHIVNESDCRVEVLAGAPTRSNQPLEVPTTRLIRTRSPRLARSPGFPTFVESPLAQSPMRV